MSRYSPQGRAAAMAYGAAQQAYRVAARRAQRDRDAIARVRALHAPIDHDGMTVCDHCAGLTDTIIEHPCATIRALDEQEPDTTT